MNSNEVSNKELLYLDHPRLFDYHQLKLFTDWQLAQKRSYRKHRPYHTKRELFLTK